MKLLLAGCNAHQRTTGEESIAAIVETFYYKARRYGHSFYITLRNIAEESGLSLATTHKWMTRLNDRGIIDRIFRGSPAGPNAKTRWASVYLVATKGFSDALSYFCKWANTVVEQNTPEENKQDEKVGLVSFSRGRGLEDLPELEETVEPVVEKSKERILRKKHIRDIKLERQYRTRRRLESLHSLIADAEQYGRPTHPWVCMLQDRLAAQGRDGCYDVHDDVDWLEELNYGDRMYGGRIYNHPAGKDVCPRCTVCKCVLRLQFSTIRKNLGEGYWRCQTCKTSISFDKPLDAEFVASSRHQLQELSTLPELAMPDVIQEIIDEKLRWSKEQSERKKNKPKPKPTAAALAELLEAYELGYRGPATISTLQDAGMI